MHFFCNFIFCCKTIPRYGSSLFSGWIIFNSMHFTGDWLKSRWCLLMRATGLALLLKIKKLKSFRTTSTSSLGVNEVNSTYSRMKSSLCIIYISCCVKRGNSKLIKWFLVSSSTRILCTVSYPSSYSSADATLNPTLFFCLRDFLLNNLPHLN